MKYEVSIIYRGLCNYIVEADTPQQAEELAQEKFANAHTPVVLGNEFEELDEVCTAQPLPEGGVS